MLKQLLKYEFKATSRLYGGLYLALALLSVMMGLTFRQAATPLAVNVNFQRFEAGLALVYVSVILAIAVLCFVNTVRRFYQNLLGREGYLMHTLPVTETQLIVSKLLTSMVWVLCSMLVGIVCITTMISIGVFDSDTFLSIDWGSWNNWKRLFETLFGELGGKFWMILFWSIVINLARLASIILCVYAACMVAHQFKKHVMVAGIVAFAGMNMVENQITRVLGTDNVGLIMDVHVRFLYYSSGESNVSVLLTTNVGYLICFAVTAAIAAAYFFLTRWLMKNKLNLE